jgi:hypothetical protein
VWLTFLATVILIISNIEFTYMQNLRRVYKTTEGPTEDLKTDLSIKFDLSIFTLLLTDCFLTLRSREFCYAYVEKRKREENSRRAT